MQQSDLHILNSPLLQSSALLYKFCLSDQTDGLVLKSMLQSLQQTAQGSTTSTEIPIITRSCWQEMPVTSQQEDFNLLTSVVDAPNLRRPAPSRRSCRCFCWSSNTFISAWRFLSIRRILEESSEDPTYPSAYMEARSRLEKASGKKWKGKRATPSRDTLDTASEELQFVLFVFVCSAQCGVRGSMYEHCNSCTSHLNCPALRC